MRNVIKKIERLAQIVSRFGANTAAIILFILGSGPVKGFAVTLGIGILTTLFCAYFFARHLSSLYAMKNKENKISL